MFGPMKKLLSLVPFGRSRNLLSLRLADVELSLGLAESEKKPEPRNDMERAQQAAELGAQYESMVSSPAFRDLEDGLKMMRQTLLNKMLEGKADPASIREAVRMLDDILRVAPYRIKNGKQNREFLQRGGTGMM